MKCTIKSIRSIEFTDCIKTRVAGFVPTKDFVLIPEHIFKWMLHYEGVHVTVKKKGLSIVAWGTAVCSENDTYDPDKGAHIAESKAKMKLYRFLRNFSEYMANYFMSLADVYNDDFLKYDHCFDHEEDHVQYLGSLNDASETPDIDED